MSRLMLAVILAALLVPALCLAQAPTDSKAAPAATVIPNAKIAWMDLQQVIFTCDEGKARFAEVQKFVDDKNKENEKLRNELEKLREQLSVQGSKLTEDALADLQSQIEEKDTYLQRFRQDTEKEIENRRVRATNYLGRRMQAVLDKIAKEKGLSAILFFTHPATPGWIRL